MKWVHIFFIVLALCLLALVVLAATAPEQATRQVEGRYQIVMDPGEYAFCFLLDSQTGRVWRALQSMESEEEGWPPMGADSWWLMKRVDQVTHIED